jgi:hypothetical protein
VLEETETRRAQMRDGDDVEYDADAASRLTLMLALQECYYQYRHLMSLRLPHEGFDFVQVSKSLPPASNAVLKSGSC